MKKFFGFVRKLLGSLWQALSFCRRVAANLVFLALLVLLLVLIFQEAGPPVPRGAALVWAPSGRIVEEQSESVLSGDLFGEAAWKETRLRDILDVIDHARKDDRIRLLVLDLRQMGAAGLSKLQEIGRALDRFQSAGKEIIAFSDFFTQSQYYLASCADSVYVNPMGGVWLNGFGLYRKYLKTALDRLKVRFHVFRVGTYKSALEPLLRDDMSPQAREANLLWLNRLWTLYKADVAARRHIRPEDLDDYINGFAGNLAAVSGDFARMALNFGLVDDLKNPDEVRQELIQRVGRDEETKNFKQVRFDDYLEAIGPSLHKTHPHRGRVGIIVARGLILDGTQPAGTIGGDSLSDLIRRARSNKQVKALVLRIDSGGGSALASEMIRREVELTRRVGKPVIASMSSVAASGGYWIAMAADEIWASPATLTGSIGIFGAFPTFEESLAALGIHSDGVGTTRMADAFDPTRPMDPQLEDAMQQMMQQGYRRFVQQVAADRGMPVEAVEAVAEGRVWDGQTARRLGLVDHLGGLQAAVRAAAARAGLKTYDIVYIQRPLSAREQLIRRLNRLLYIMVQKITASWWPAAADMVPRMWGGTRSPWQLLHDPLGLYAWCPTCPQP